MYNNNRQVGGSVGKLMVLNSLFYKFYCVERFEEES